MYLGAILALFYISKGVKLPFLPLEIRKLIWKFVFPSCHVCPYCDTVLVRINDKGLVRRCMEIHDKSVCCFIFVSSNRHR